MALEGFCAIEDAEAGLLELVALPRLKREEWRQLWRPANSLDFLPPGYPPRPRQLNSNKKLSSGFPVSLDEG